MPVAGCRNVQLAGGAAVFCSQFKVINSKLDNVTDAERCERCRVSLKTL